MDPWMIAAGGLVFSWALTFVLWHKSEREWHRMVSKMRDTETVYINGQRFDVPKDAPGQYHSDGVPIGMRPGDPVDPKNFQAIWDFTQGQR